MNPNIHQKETEERKKTTNIIQQRGTIIKLLIMCAVMCYIVNLLFIQLFFDANFSTKINTLSKNKDILLTPFFATTILLIFSLMSSYALLIKNKAEKRVLRFKTDTQKNNTYDFTPLKDQEPLVAHIKYILNKITDYKETNERKRQELSDTGRSYLLTGIIIQFFCIVVFQIFSHISPEKELFKIYGMVSCAAIFMIIVAVGIWHLNQAHNYSKNLSKIMNAELCITKCLLICNLDIEKKEKYELLRVELLNAEIKNDAKDTASAGIPYKIAFDIFKDMIKKNQ